MSLTNESYQQAVKSLHPPSTGQQSTAQRSSPRKKEQCCQQSRPLQQAAGSQLTKKVAENHSAALTRTFTSKSCIVSRQTGRRAHAHMAGNPEGLGERQADDSRTTRIRWGRVTHKLQQCASHALSRSHSTSCRKGLAKGGKQVTAQAACSCSHAQGVEMQVRTAGERGRQVRRKETEQKSKKKGKTPAKRTSIQKKGKHQFHPSKGSTFNSIQCSCKVQLMSTLSALTPKQLSCQSTARDSIQKLRREKREGGSRVQKRVQ